MSSVPPETLDLLDYIDASPSPWHCVTESVRRLHEAGYRGVGESTEHWPVTPGKKLYVVRGGGSLIAWKVGQRLPSDAGFRVVTAHTDSPSLRVKPRPDRHKEGYASLGLETYGSALTATWTDRDLSIAGRVTLRAEGGREAITTKPFRHSSPVCRIPNVAIHMNKGVNEEGLKLNAQNHLPAIWALAEEPTPGAFAAWVAEHLEVEADRILGWDLCLYDLLPSAIGGRDGEFIHAPRLDNQASCHSALSALLDSDASEHDTTAVVALFDHEEIGSRTSRGAQSTFLRDVLTRASGEDASDLPRAVANSFMVSADMAHGVHPHYADKHDAEHRPMLGGGPVLKTHSEWRYATDAESSATWRAICQDADVPLQEFVNRTDLRCGSTVGPIVSAELGMQGVDVGCAMWSMHSIRETAGSADPPLMIRAMSRFFGWGS